MIAVGATATCTLRFVVFQMAISMLSIFLVWKLEAYTVNVYRPTGKSTRRKSPFADDVRLGEGSSRFLRLSPPITFPGGLGWIYCGVGYAGRTGQLPFSEKVGDTTLRSTGGKLGVPRGPNLGKFG